MQSMPQLADGCLKGINPHPHSDRAVSRRGFVQRALGAAGAILAAPLIAPASIWGAEDKAVPSNRITIGMIGMGRQAYHANLLPFLVSPDTQVVAVCDVDSWRLEQGVNKVKDYYAVRSPGGSYRGCLATRDFREVLERKDIDAVMISTPDHWHALIAVEAAKAGKDVALEKPISLSVLQGRRISDAMKKYRRVFRTDTEVRFAGEFQRLCECVRNGRIGKIRRILAEVPTEAAPVALPAAMPVPAELDYARWLGPAPEAPYTDQRVHTPRNLSARPGWMIVRDYCDGIICNWGTHLLDIVQWGHNSEHTGPVEVEGRGQFHPPGGLSNVLRSFEVFYRYADGVELTYRMTGRAAVRFEGTGGWLEAVWGQGLTAERPELLEKRQAPGDISLPLINEKVDFIQSIKSRGSPLIPAEVGHRTNTMCQLGLISIMLGQKLNWDPERERFADPEAANRLLDRPLREPWQITL
jgi:myo-inositol 2-dehydrogenase / D-chiro-inositol 1-dehydrogenase